MSIELTASGYVCHCDECGKIAKLAATNPKGATAILRTQGWHRHDHIATTKQYLWNCGCERAA